MATKIGDFSGFLVENCEAVVAQYATLPVDASDEFIRGGKNDLKFFACAIRGYIASKEGDKKEAAEQRFQEKLEGIEKLRLSYKNAYSLDEMPIVEVPVDSVEEDFQLPEDYADNPVAELLSNAARQLQETVEEKVHELATDVLMTKTEEPSAPMHPLEVTTPPVRSEGNPLSRLTNSEWEELLASNVDAGEEEVSAVAPADREEDPATPARIQVTMDVGLGNSLYIRGEGKGLSWEKGVPMQWNSGNVWTFETTEPIGPYKILLNDEKWEAGENHTIALGETQEVVVKF